MGLLLNTDGVKDTVVPAEPQLDTAVATNFQRFDGLTGSEDNYDAHMSKLGLAYTDNVPRPGQLNSPQSDIVYTPGPIYGLVNTLGGQPLPVANWLYRLGRGYTPGRTTKAPQWRLGKNKLGGQNNGGVAQTVALSEITNAPPIPGDITAIIAGFG